MLQLKLERCSSLRIILASQSLYRGHALEVLGLKYEKIPSDFPEHTIKASTQTLRAKKLAIAKAKLTAKNHPDALIIAADMFAVHKGRALEKPRSIKEAHSMLRKLSGNTFEIISGLAVLYNGECKSTTAKCKVTFRKLSDFEIKDYCARYPVLKFAAAFDDDGMLRFTQSMSGNYHSRAGLPLDKLIPFLREFGVKV